MPVSPVPSTPMERVFRRIDFEQLKLPLGFVRLVEAVFCLIVFVAFHGWRFSLVLGCSKVAQNATFQFAHIDIDDYTIKRCNGSEAQLFEDIGTAGADFFAYLVPFSLLLSVVGLLVYLFAYAAYASDDRFPVLDLIVTAVLALGWMVGTLAFSVSARRIEAATTPEEVSARMEAIDACSGAKKDECVFDSVATSYTLTIASFAGVGLFILFASNIWYVYKETPFFRERQQRRNLHHGNLPANEPYTLE